MQISLREVLKTTFCLVWSVWEKIAPKKTFTAVSGSDNSSQRTTPKKLKLKKKNGNVLEQQTLGKVFQMVFKGQGRKLVEDHLGNNYRSFGKNYFLYYFYHYCARTHWSFLIQFVADQWSNVGTGCQTKNHFFFF